MLRSLTQHAGVFQRLYSTAATKTTPAYFVNRTKNDGLPVYTEFKNGRTNESTVIRRIDGDANALLKDLQATLFTDAPKDFALVKERSNSIHIKGIYMNEIKEWLIMKGY